MHISTPPTTPITTTRPRAGRLIDYIIQAARAAGSEGQPVALKDLFTGFREMFPDLQSGQTHGSHDACLNFHTINMKSRFQYSSNPESENWIREPLFKRVKRGSYMLLSEAEVKALRKALAAGAEIVKADEYDVEELVRQFGGAHL